MNTLKERTCPGCKIILAYNEELEHYKNVGIARYGVASAECSAIFTEVLNLEQELYGYPPAHRLIIDSYAVQHPRDKEYQKTLNLEERIIKASIKSIYIHLIALYCALEKKMQLTSIAKYMGKILSNMAKDNFSFEELAPPNNLGSIKINNIEQFLIEKNPNLDSYTAMAYIWANSSWAAWKEHHKTIKRLCEKYMVS